MKILIIKLGAKGDIIRTLPILIALKEKYPDSEILWLSKKESEEILKTSHYIEKVLTFPAEINEKFDILYNFDIDNEATTLAKAVKADKKYGFCEESGFPSAFNLPSEYYLNTLFDDELKKTNNKTYQEMMFQAAELPYKKQHHPINLSAKEKEYAESFLKFNSLNKDKLIGIHIGASSRWPSKSWHMDNIKEFIKKAKEKSYEILLFGGPDEIEKHKKLSDELEKEKIKIFRNNPGNSDLEFCSLMSLCRTVISGDSFALHIALALKKPTIGLFFCTSPDEVEDYGLLKKIVSSMLYDFFPEKSDEYSEELVKSISPEDVLKEIK